MTINTENMKTLHSYIDNMAGTHLNELIRVCAQPSVSAQNIGVEDCCDLLIDMFTKMGMNAKILESPTNPAVFAEIKSKREHVPTVLFYGHYDVQPADPVEAWNTPPFEPTVINNTLYGRGTADNKGQFMAHVMAVRSYLETFGNVPVNIKFILDGEEESGSPSLPWIAEHNRELLAADVMYESDGAMYTDEIPLIAYGNRGVMSFDIDISTGTTDNHSGNKGNVIENAAWKMVKMLSTIVDDDGHCLVEGFYDTITPITPLQRQMTEELEFNPEELAKLYGVERIKYHDDKFEHYRQLMFLPTFSINGISSGYSGSGNKTIIPCHAKAKVDIRLVQGQRGADIYEKVKRHILNVEPTAVVSDYFLMEASVTDPSIPIIAKAREAVEMVYGVKPVNLPLLGGSLPTYVFTDILNMPVISVPYGNPDENNHAPNENLKLPCYYKGIHASAQALYEIGTLTNF